MSTSSTTPVHPRPPQHPPVDLFSLSARQRDPQPPPIPPSSARSADGPPPPSLAQADPATAAVESVTPRKPSGGGASVLARVQALEAQAQRQEGPAGAGAEEALATTGGATVAFRRARSDLEDVREVGVAMSADEGAGGDASPFATHTSVPTRPQPTPSSTAPLIPSSSSGLVAKRRSWIELADRPNSASFSPPGSASSRPGSRPVSSFCNDPTSPLSASSSSNSRSASPASRTLSSAAIAAVADTPPRVTRPPLPPKSAARLSRASSRMSTYEDEPSPSLPPDEIRSRSNSAASSVPASATGSAQGHGHGSLRKVPSLATSPPPPSGAGSGDDKPLSPSPSTTPALGLSHPRPRPRLATASSSGTGRTPALSVAGSTGSSRPSSGAFSPSFAPPPGQYAFSYSGSHEFDYSTNYSERNSFFSNESAHGHDLANMSASASASAGEWPTPATTAADFSPAPTPEASPEVSMTEDAAATLKPAKKRGSKPPPPALQLEPASLAPPGRASVAVAELDGLGISYDAPLPSALTLPLTAASTTDGAGGARPSFDGEGDFQSNLERLSLFAASLPSPYPPALAQAAQSPVAEAPPRAPFARARAGTSGSEDRLSPQAQADDRTLVLPSSSRPSSIAADEPLPLPPPLPFAREARPPRSREFSAASSTAASSRSASSSRRPSLLNLPRTKRSYASLRSPPSLERLTAGGGGGESEAYFSPEETDFLSTEDEDEESYHLGLRSAANGGRRFLGFSEFGGRDSGSGGEGFSGFTAASGGAFGSPDTSFATGTTRTSYASSSAGGPRFGGGGLQRDSSAGSGLWNEDVPAMPFLPPLGSGAGAGAAGEGSGLQFVMNAPEEDVVDWSGKGIEKKELPAETTHLMLSRCTTPFQIAPLLTLTVPLLTHGLVVLDISHCGLSEVPSAIAQCCFLEELDLTGNPLATGTLPSFLGTLPSLNVLLADNCNLSSLPNSLAQLSRLRALHLRNNKLRMLPSWLSRLGALEALLVDGNPFHWQIHHLVRPLFVDGAVKPPAVDHQAVESAPVTRAVTPAPQSVRSMSPLPTSSLIGSPPLPLAASLSASPYASPVVENTISPPVGSPAFFRSTAATPIYNKWSSPPSATPSSAPAPIDLDQVERELERARQAAEAALTGASAVSSPALSPPVLSPLAIGTPPMSATSAGTSFSAGGAAGEAKEGGKEKKKWTKKLMKKVSGARMRSGSTASTRPGQLESDSRTYSAPITRAEESEAEEKTSRFGSFGRKKKSSSKTRGGIVLHGERAAPIPQKRRSFLLLDSFPSPRSATPRDLPSPTPQHEHDHKAALRSVLAYLRDLDDLSPDVSLPTIPLEASTPRLRHSPSLESTSPSLRHSPSLGAIGINSRSVSSSSASISAMRRAQSTRRLPSNSSSPRPDSSRLSAYYDDEGANDGRSPTPLASSSSSKLADEPGKREAVLKEIVETEQTYLRGLEELCGIYVASASVPLSTAGTGKKDTVLPAAERRAVFSNIEAIRDFHRKILLPDLLAAVRGGGESVEVAGKVGEVFMQHASFLKIYSSYINGFDDALARIQTWAKTTSSSSRPGTSAGNYGSPALGSLTSFDATAGIASSLSSSQKKRIKSWMKRCKAHPSHSQISLESYLLLPIQRIPRYRLLLESLSACTPSPATATASPANLDPSASPSVSLASSLRLEPHPTLAQAVQEMDAVAVILNESKRENEGRAQLLNWQNRITQKFKSSLVQPHRALLRSGNLTLVRSVKRNTTHVEPPLPSLYRKPAHDDESELFTLFQENKQVELIALLCTDLLVLCKAPLPPLDQDPNSPIELYTVLRLNSSSGVLGGGGSGKGEPPVSLMPNDGMLRIRVGDKAIIYVQCGERDAPPTRKNAVDWMNAINLQWEMNA
ncbi:hypothetical protein JCM6882_006617 [Rhodosporidiobolus microsporus]